MGAPFVHPTAVIDDGAAIGDGTRVWHFAHVMRSRIGRDCVLGQDVFVGADVSIGDGCRIQNHVSVVAGVTLEPYVFVGPSAVFTNDLRPRARTPRHDYLPTLVRHDASIGANATILCGTTIGAWAMVGAGAVVTRDVPDRAIVVGLDRIVGYACDCGATLPEDRRCRACGRVLAG